MKNYRCVNAMVGICGLKRKICLGQNTIKFSNLPVIFEIESKNEKQFLGKTLLTIALNSRKGETYLRNRRNASLASKFYSSFDTSCD